MIVFTLHLQTGIVFMKCFHALLLSRSSQHPEVDREGLWSTVHPQSSSVLGGPVSLVGMGSMFSSSFLIFPSILLESTWQIQYWRADVPEWLQRLQSQLCSEVQLSLGYPVSWSSQSSQPFLFFIHRLILHFREAGKSPFCSKKSNVLCFLLPKC